MLRMPFCMRFIRVRWAARPLQRCSTEPRIRPAVSRYPCRATPVRFRCATITVPPSFQPLHTFGEGKSYTTFACSDVSVNKEENGAAVSFTVENTGAMAGTSVPCLYVRKRSGGVVARIKELKAFTRISLAPGEKKEVSFQLSKEEMNFVQIPGKPEVICHDYELMLEDGAEKWWSGNVTEM